MTDDPRKVSPQQQREADLTIFRAKVAEAQAKHVLSQARLARLADTDPGTLNKYLNGADIRISTFTRICRAAGLRVMLVADEEIAEKRTA